MAQKGKKKASHGNHPGRKAGEDGKGGREDSGGPDWIPGDPEAAEADLILDADPAQELVDKAREFGPSDNPFTEKMEDRLPEENPVPMPVAEDDVLLEEQTPDSDGGRPPAKDRESGFLEAMFLGFHFPAGKEAVACHLALDAYKHGGPAETFHDLVVQLDRTFFKDLHDLKGALAERFAWESDHGRPQGGKHGR